MATRNYIGILTSVNCSATVARMVAAQFGEGSELLAEYPNVDGVVALTHGSGCGMAGAGEGFELLRRTLSGYARHPNFAALLVIGLGCEVNQVRALTEGFDLAQGTPLLPMTIQDMGGTRATVREASSRIRELAGEVNNVSRTDVPAASWSSDWNVAAPMPTRAFRPTRRWAWPPTSWSARAAPPSWARRRRSTAPSIS